MEIPFTIFFKSELFKSEKPKIKKKKKHEKLFIWLQKNASGRPKVRESDNS
jgi:hypothetical protein